MPATRTATKQPEAEGGLTMRQAVARDLQARVPGFKVSWKFGHASLETGTDTGQGKVYCFITRAGHFAMKLPAERIESLLASGEASPMRMGKRTMREWVSVPEMESALRLLGEAEHYVAALAVAKPRSRRKAL